MSKLRGASRDGRRSPTTSSRVWNGRWFVSASTDAIFAPYRGAVWTADSIVPLGDTAELSFVVGEGDQLRFYERVRHPSTWSEYVQRQAAKQYQQAST